MTSSRRRLVEPLGSRLIRQILVEGEARSVTPTADSLVRIRAIKKEKKKRVVIRFKR